jgi:hypothetical protein
MNFQKHFGIKKQPFWATDNRNKSGKLLWKSQSINITTHT